MSEDRGAILARRKRFLIVALAGVGCTSPPPAEPPPHPAETPTKVEDPPDAGTPEPVLPTDTDKDGFTDDRDKCPDAVATYSSQDGCPRPCLMIIPDSSLQVRDNVYFGPGQSKLKPVSFQFLDEIVQVLKEHEDYAVTLGGHTHKGEPDRVAKERAEAVRKYLVEKGVAEDRITVEAFGHDRPLDYKAERNRRVEFRLEQKK